MEEAPRWLEAQRNERDFWAGIAASDAQVLRVLADNAQKAAYLRHLLPSTPKSCLEVGIGPFGVGVIGFLPEIPFRTGLDSLCPLPLDSADPVCALVRALRRPVRYIVGYGESLPFKEESIDLVVCCNVIDHALDPGATLSEIHRVLKSDGQLLLDVDTFSVAGLVKWHFWTKYAHKDETLVKAHPHRLLEVAVRLKLRVHGFKIAKSSGHNLMSACLGHARVSLFLAKKRQEQRVGSWPTRGRAVRAVGAG